MKTSLLQYELEKRGNSFTHIIGCDEVGRGCLAGPVVAAAVIFNSLEILEKNLNWAKEIKDSKLLSPNKRSELALHIKQSAVTWGIGVVTPQRIDQINIHNASLLAMKKAVEHVEKQVAKKPRPKNFICVDGKFIIPNLQNYTQEAVVGGDNKVFSISAASILAKVYRDELMVKLHKKFPEYSLSKHKGYATLEHRTAIKQHGLSSIHRISFCGNIV